MSCVNVLFLAEELRVGGAETYFYKIENKIDIHNINFYTAAVNGKCFNKLKNKSMYFEYKKGVLSKLNVIKNIVLSKNIQVIHANSLRLAMISCVVRKLYKSNLKIVYTKHNITILEKINTRLFAGFVNKNIDIVLAVCNSDKKNMLNIGVKNEKIKVVPNSIDLKQFKFNSKYLRDKGKDFKIGILARLSEEKNHKFFIDVIKQINLSKKKIDFTALIGGDGPLNTDIKGRIEQNNLQDKIKMLGNIENANEFLSNVDVILLVSTREIFPMTLLEAMSVGSIVVSVDIGGIRDCVIDNKTGYVISHHDSKKFCSRIIDIYNNHDKNMSMIYNARKFVESYFNLEVTIKTIEKLYNEV